MNHALYPLRKTRAALTAVLVLSSGFVTLAQSTKEKEPTAVTVQGPVQVQGTVDVQGPVEIQGYVEVLNDALRTPFNKRITASIPLNTINTFLTLPTIPAGKRLVIEAIGITALVKANSRATAFLNLTGLGEIVSVPIPLTAQGVFGLDNREHCMGLHTVRIVVDPRQFSVLQANVFRNDASDVATVTCNIVGYLEDIPATL